MKGLVTGIVLGGILVFLILTVIGLSMNDPSITGNVINDSSTQNTQLTQSTNQLTEQEITNDEQLLKENMVFTRGFEVTQFVSVSINITSDDYVNYALLPDYELDHYQRGETFKSYENIESILYWQDSYNLNPGKYAVVISSGENPANIHLIIKGKPL